MKFNNYLFKFSLLFIVINDRFSDIMERLQAFLNRFFVVVYPAARLRPAQQSFRHRFIAGVEIQHKLTWRHLKWTKKILYLF